MISNITNTDQYQFGLPNGFRLRSLNSIRIGIYENSKRATWTRRPHVETRMGKPNISSQTIRFRANVLVFRNPGSPMNIVGYDRYVFFIFFRSQTPDACHLYESTISAGAAQCHLQPRIDRRHTKLQNPATTLFPNVLIVKLISKSNTIDVTRRSVRPSDVREKNALWNFRRTFTSCFEQCPLITTVMNTHDDSLAEGFRQNLRARAQKIIRDFRCRHVGVQTQTRHFVRLSPMYLSRGTR